MIVRRRLLPAVVFALAAPAAAHAAALAPLKDETDSVALAGDRVVFSDESIREVPFGGRVRTLFSSTGYATMLAASPQRVAAWDGGSATDSGGFVFEHSLLAGPPQGPLEPIGGITSPIEEYRTVDVSGTSVAVIEHAPGQGKIDGAPFGASPAADLRIAGPVAAIRQKDTLIVYRRSDGGELYRATVPHALQFDVDADGTLAVLADHAVVRAAPADPAPVVIARGARYDVPPRIAGGRVMFGRGAHGGTQLAMVANGAVTALGVPVRAVWASDFDGARYALATRGCLFAGRVGEPRSRAAAGACPKVIAHPFRLRARGRVVTLRVRCDVTPGACAGRVLLTDYKRHVLAQARFSRRFFAVASLRMVVPRSALHKRTTTVFPTLIPRGGRRAEYDLFADVRR